ncbi:hypothetical protein Glove_195g71 [Diversispora epigaea]|uniref:Uncharacterized protein n=1 Tax=Diversispora epigaea TaxID=1348612 RepID=A0A397IKY6_9GLOM|nr:hypothetical protein Glove_195g71 [Diversispora epigaea]
MLNKERKLKVKEVFEEVEFKLMKKKCNDDVSFDKPRIFFKIKIVDNEVLFDDIVFGEPSDQKGISEVLSEEYEEVLICEELCEGFKLMKKKCNDDVSFDKPRIFFKIKIVDNEVLFDDIVFGEPSDQKGMYIEFKGECWKELLGED